MGKRIRIRLRSGLAFALLAALALSCAALYAEHTRRWRQATYEDFLKGTARGIAVRSDGGLELAPRFQLVAEADASFLWSLRAAPNGVLYAAGGSPAKVFRFSGEGKPAQVFQSEELSAQTIAVDSKGFLYVATAPDGKVYRISPQGEKTVFFEPKTKYIWDLAFDRNGTLYVATGDKGEIFAVTPDGKSEVFYASDDAHVRVLAVASSDSLLAGTEPDGRVLRIPFAAPPKGQQRTAFVLYETAKREITALIAAPDGTVYASGIGEKQKIPMPGIVTSAAQVAHNLSSLGGISIGGTGSAQVASPVGPFPALLSSAIYRIAPDGAPEEIWSSREEVVYALGLNSDGRLLAGTGNSGTLLTIDGRGVFAQLAKSGASQITGIVRGSDGRTYLCTANPGKLFSLGPEFESEGTFESRSFDAQLFSQWGRLEWWGPAPQGASASAEPRISFFVRTGNTDDPGREWSPWTGPYSRSGESVKAPPARFAQWKLAMRGGAPGASVSWVSLAYLPHNVAPTIDAIVLQDSGIRLQTILPPIGIPGQATVAVRLPPSQNTLGIASPLVPPPRVEPTPQGVAQKGFRSVIWSARDENEDDLRYSIYFRGEGEHDWKLLKENLEQKFFSWDTTSMPDGAYYLKIVASDAASNPPASALTGSRESERFEVDNTPPVIEKLEVIPVATKSGANSVQSVAARFTARDAQSGIDRAQYSVDGGEWILAAPAGGLNDALEEKYEITLTNVAPGEHTLAVRAFDRFENAGSAKKVFSVAAAKP
ncbi:MAG TPA: hypothetical protein VEH49_04900 [Methylomirabilota bacterium]|nr:hypothetical protein [Methylomirabilota bacterium]